MDTDDIDIGDVAHNINVFEDNDPEIIESNGQPYFVGWGDHGWFTIAHVDFHADERPETDTEWFAQTVGKYPLFNFPPEAADLISLIIAER